MSMTVGKNKKIYPKSRQRWSDVSRKRGIDTRGMMTRFFARFAMAHAFRGVVFEGYSPSSVRGYSALLKLQLAYSALDVFVKAVNSFEPKLGRKKKDIYEYMLINEALAEKLQKRHQLLVFLMNMCTKNTIVRRLHLFMGDAPCIANDASLNDRLQKIKSDFEKAKDVVQIKGDVLFVAASLRHGVAHGDMSLYSVGVENSAVVRLIESLTQNVLQLCDTELEKIIDAVELLPITKSEEITVSTETSQSDHYFCACDTITKASSL